MKPKLTRRGALPNFWAAGVAALSLHPSATHAEDPELIALHDDWRQKEKASNNANERAIVYLTNAHESLSYG